MKSETITRHAFALELIGNLQFSVSNLKLPFLLAAALLALLSTLDLRLSTAFAQGTAFTYQGRLAENGAPANGWYAMRFTLWDDASHGQALGQPQLEDRVPVTNGLFTVLLDFGVNTLGIPYFHGEARWLEISMDHYQGANFVTLVPRQPITPAPYAIYSMEAGAAATMSASGLIGTLPDARLSANVSLMGSSIESAEITDGTIVAADINPTSFNSTFWRVTGNAGTTAGTHFLGTTDDEPLEIKVNRLRALRIEFGGDSSDSNVAPDGAPNLIGGAPINLVASGVVGATIAGGGATNFSGVAYTNVIRASFAAIGGGRGNQITSESSDSTIGGGTGNAIGTNSSSSVIGGGTRNQVEGSSDHSTVGGGYYNLIHANSFGSIIGAGASNRIGTLSYSSTMSGGFNNTIWGDSQQSTIGGGKDNSIQDSAQDCTISGGPGQRHWQFLPLQRNCRRSAEQDRRRLG